MFEHLLEFSSSSRCGASYGIFPCEHLLEDSSKTSCIDVMHVHGVKGFLNFLCWRFLFRCRWLSQVGIRILGRFLLKIRCTTILFCCLIRYNECFWPSRVDVDVRDCVPIAWHSVGYGPDRSNAIFAKGYVWYVRLLKQWSWLLWTCCLTRDQGRRKHFQIEGAPKVQTVNRK